MTSKLNNWIEGFLDNSAVSKILEWNYGKKYPITYFHQIAINLDHVFFTAQGVPFLRAIYN